LLEHGRGLSDKEVAEYAGVASFRNYHEYLKTKDTTLDFLMSPISEEIITKNRLLEIKRWTGTLFIRGDMEINYGYWL